MFRIDATTFQSFCFHLETQYGLKPSRSISVIENFGMFLYTLALGASNRVQERFQYSGETVSRYFNEVLKAVCLLSIDIIKLVDPDFSTTPQEIIINPRYMHI
jgi:hypothetical protein